MAKLIQYLLLFLFHTSLFAMERPGLLQVTLNAPEYWKEINGVWVQYDLDRNGNLCSLGSREGSLELGHVTAFPKLQGYLATTGNKLKGFDPKMFNVLKNCLQLSYIYHNANSDEQKQIEGEIEGIFNDVQVYPPGKLVDAVYVARLAGLSMIERLAIKAFNERKDDRGRSIRIDDVYPSFESLEQIGPGENSDDSLNGMPCEHIKKYADMVNENTMSESSSEYTSDSELSSESDSETDEESEEENELPDCTFLWNNFSPEILLKSLEKRAPAKKAQKAEKNEPIKNAQEESAKEQKALTLFCPLWALSVNSEDEFNLQAAKRIKALDARIKEALVKKRLTENTQETYPPYCNINHAHSKQLGSQKAIFYTMWGKFTSLLAFLFCK